MQLKSAKIATSEDGTRTMTLTIVLPDTVTDAMAYERECRRVLNDAGGELMKDGLTRMDTDGEDIRTGGRIYTLKCRQTETYQTSFTAVEILRNVYQHSGGGRTWVPLEDRARIVRLSTPHFASLIAGALADHSGRDARRLMQEHHGREMSLNFMQQLTAETARMALAKEKKWSYELSTPADSVKWIALGIDGTCAPMCEGGWRQVMVGTITLCGNDAEVLETVYIANAPEDGKASFYQRMKREVDAVKKRYPAARWVGISDGSRDLRAFLEEHTEVLLLDFFHLAHYVSAAAVAIYGETTTGIDWAGDALHAVRHDAGGATEVLEELKFRLETPDLPELRAADRATVERAIGYMEANLDRMDYPGADANGYPVGSGVTEAACKIVVKARICASGMRWHEESMNEILCLRAMRHSTDRWDQFWRKIIQYGW